jgi:hypothetical protein
MINVHVKDDDREKKRIARDQYEREAKMRDNINKERGCVKGNAVLIIYNGL